jgi:hypothetical protein
MTNIEGKIFRNSIMTANAVPGERRQNLADIFFNVVQASRLFFKKE